jgi:hypothetical protein
MVETYKAILRGDRLEWSGDVPELTGAEQGIEVYVTIPRNDVASDGKAMAAALSRIAASGSIAEISDPSA